MDNGVGSSNRRLGLSQTKAAEEKSRAMNIIGCDLHTRYQVMAWVKEETGEIMIRWLEPGKEEVAAFHAGWPRGAILGIEAPFPRSGSSGCW
ncbi:MAG TPA: hypothetical protein VGW33_08875 [Terriglobia bacterium]|nr:hypothetical protein [Terriglobia bacterium]